MYLHTSYHTGTRGLPMCDARVRTGVTADTIRAACADQGEDPDGAAGAFLTRLFCPDDPFHVSDRVDAVWEWACTGAWERLHEDAPEMFPGYDVHVYSAGRSGGWCVIQGLPDPEDDDASGWSPELRDAWLRWEHAVRETAGEVPYDMAVLALLNWWPEARRAACYAVARVSHG